MKSVCHNTFPWSYWFLFLSHLRSLLTSNISRIFKEVNFFQWHCYQYGLCYQHMMNSHSFVCLKKKNYRWTKVYVWQNIIPPIFFSLSVMSCPYWRDALEIQRFHRNFTVSQEEMSSILSSTFPYFLDHPFLIELKILYLIYTSCIKVTLNLRYGRLKRKAFITTSYVHFHQLIWCTSGPLIAMCLKKPDRLKINFKILCFSWF